MANVNRPIFSNNIPLSSSRFSSSLNPAQDQVYDLGTSSLQWRNIFVQSVFVTGQISGSVATSATASYLIPGTYAITSSWAQSASNAVHSQTATSSSFATSAYTASYLIPGTYQVTASWAITASHAIGSLSSSHAVNALTASHAINSLTSSHSVNALSSSFALFATSAGSSNLSNTASVLFNQYTQRGFKTISLTTSSYTNALTISLAANQSAYIKLSICGNAWPGVGPIGYVADFLLQKGTFDTASTQPGVIINETNNNAGGRTISSQIFDPGVATGSANFGLQFILSGNYDIPSAILVYDIMGSCSIA